jgi:hypothetical protein
MSLSRTLTAQRHDAPGYKPDKDAAEKSQYLNKQYPNKTGNCPILFNRIYLKFKSPDDWFMRRCWQCRWIKAFLTSLPGCSGVLNQALSAGRLAAMKRIA